MCLAKEDGVDVHSMLGWQSAVQCVLARWDAFNNARWSSVTKTDMKQQMVVKGKRIMTSLAFDNKMCNKYVTHKPKNLQTGTSRMLVPLPVKTESNNKTKPFDWLKKHLILKNFSLLQEAKVAHCSFNKKISALLLGFDHTIIKPIAFKNCPPTIQLAIGAHEDTLNHLQRQIVTYPKNCAR